MINLMRKEVKLKKKAKELVGSVESLVIKPQSNRSGAEGALLILKTNIQGIEPDANSSESMCREGSLEEDDFLGKLGKRSVTELVPSAVKYMTLLMGTVIMATWTWLLDIGMRW